MNEKIKEKSCGIIIFSLGEKEHEYLILQYEEGHFDFPKGHVEPNETEIQTALRELKEETGITQVDFKEGFREKISYSYVRNKQNYEKEVCFYLAETKQKKIILSHEHIGFRWLSFKDAQEIATYSLAKELLRKAENFLKIKTL